MSSPGGQLLGQQVVARDIAALAFNAGIKDLHQLVTAVAIGLSESQGYEAAFNDNTALITTFPIGRIVRNVETGEPVTIVDPATGKIKLSDGETVTVPLTTTWVWQRDCGIWQIGIPAAEIGTAVEKSLYGREANAAAMVSLYAARAWQPWVSYTKGIYLHDTYQSRAVRGIGNYLAVTSAAKMAEAGVPTNMITPALYFPKDFRPARAT